MSSSLFTDTIFALSSGALPSGVAVIRLSGPSVRNVLERMSGSVPVPRVASLRSLTTGTGDILDRGLVLFFEGPASFTGEDSAELQLHGGRAVIAAVLRELASMPGLRQAEAGDFTRRAFLNGKLDLAQTEALSDLIAAETEAQRLFALHNAGGAHKKIYAGWGRRLLHARAMIEAELDFAGEGDVPGSVAQQVWADMALLRDELDAYAGSYATAEIVREGFRIVLLGAPNAGKSSLLNALARRDVAIVTDIAGTTRDLIEVSLDLGGYKVIVTDTAGLRATDDQVERIGVARALEAAGKANLVLHLIEPAHGPSNPLAIDSRVWTVATKRDLYPAPAAPFQFVISATTGEGLDELIAVLSAQVREEAGLAQQQSVPFRARHMALLREGGNYLGRAVAAADDPLELRAEDLRLAANALGRIVGETDVEDLLGAIFSEFCIGK